MSGRPLPSRLRASGAACALSIALVLRPLSAQTPPASVAPPVSGEVVRVTTRAPDAHRYAGSLIAIDSVGIIIAHLDFGGRGLGAPGRYSDTIAMTRVELLEVRRRISGSSGARTALGALGGLVGGAVVGGVIGYVASYKKGDEYSGFGAVFGVPIGGLVGIPIGVIISRRDGAWLAVSLPSAPPP